MNEPQKKSGLDYKHGAAHILNTALTVLISIVAINNDWVGNRNEQLRIAYERIAVLEAANSQLRHENAELRSTDIELVSEMAMLRYKLDNDFEPLMYLETYINSIGLPIWIKAYDPISDSFEVLMTNDAYSVVYDISGKDYEGSNDFAFWPEDIAAEFEANDRTILRSRRRALFLEKVILPNKGPEIVERQIWKHYLRLPDGREAVAGIDIGAAMD